MKRQPRNSHLVFNKGYIPFLLLMLFVLSANNLLGQTFELSVHRKVINDKGGREIVYVTDKTPEPKGKRMYHWYKSRKVHTSQNNYAGELLDGEYLKYYPDSQLAEKGVFKNGLKVSVWNTWHQNGRLATRSLWKSGRISGRFVKRDSLGNTLETGTYKKGFKNGKWIYPMEGDTLYFKKGDLVPTDSITNDSLPKKPSFLKRLFKKKKDAGGESIKSPETFKKQGFFKRLFAKREKKPSTKPKKKKDRESKKPEGKADVGKDGFFKRLFGKKDKKPKKTNA